MHCPNCRSTKIQKKGKRAGKQRYKCTECGASFTKGISYKPKEIQEPLKAMSCPRCGDSHIIRDGKLPDGIQRFQCQSCLLNFTYKTLPKHDIPWVCPYCGSKLNYSGYSKKGNHEYTCTKCHKSCTADNTGKPIKRDFFSKVNNSIYCPSCNSLSVKKAGYTPRGVQRFLCKECGRTFHKDLSNIESMVNMVMLGKNLEKVSREYSFPNSELQKIMSLHYQKEKISLEQENIIIKYGYHLKVPIDYMAEYVKCSEHKCREVLQKYREKIKSTIHDAT